MLLPYFCIPFIHHNVLYFVKCTCPSCSEIPPQHHAATPVLHCCNSVHSGEYVAFDFIRPHELSLLQTVIWLLKFLFSLFSFLLRCLASPSRHRICLTVDFGFSYFCLVLMIICWIENPSCS